jgi:ubiquitin-conjugating enzyme E2 variant
MIVLKIIILILLADFATGIFHFYVDTYGVIDSKYLSVPINGLLIHHDSPKLMTEQSYWDLTKGVYKIGALIFLVSLFFNFYWELLFFLLVSAQANIIHKWAHQNKSKNLKIVNLLQRLGIIQTRRHHLHHHNGRYDSYYCVMTNVLNPILEKILFWEGVIKFLKVFKINPVQRVL